MCWRKGIGRFAVDKLGDKVSVITKKEGEEKWLKVDIDWTAYYTETEKRQIFVYLPIWRMSIRIMMLKIQMYQERN